MRTREIDLVSFEDLTEWGQKRRLHALALAATDGFGLTVRRMRLVHHGENTTYRLVTGSTAADSSRAGEVPHRSPRFDHPVPDGVYLLRVHRPGYQSDVSIRSEIAWLRALREADLEVPDPVSAPDGRATIAVGAPGLPAERTCTLLKWMNGRFVRERRPNHFRALGVLMARLHLHARRWRRPRWFVRRRWDYEGLFGESAGFTQPAAGVWDLVPHEVRSDFHRIASDWRDAVASIGCSPKDHGLIHGDLHFWNVLFRQGRPLPIDFDDCGFAHFVQDLAVPLVEALEDPAWPQLRAALLEGYETVAPFPRGLELLPVFMSARVVSLMLWGADLATVNSAVAREIDGWFTWGVRSLELIREHHASQRVARRVVKRGL